MSNSSAEPMIVLLDSRSLIRELIASYLRVRAPDLGVTEAASISDLDCAGATSYGAIVVFQHNAPVEVGKRFQSVTKVREVLPNVPVIVIADFARPDLVCEAFRAGAKGFIPTITPLSVFEHAIRTVLAGGEYVPASILALGKGAGVPDAPAEEIGVESLRFTPRQRQVLELLREGMPNKIIAYRLAMCESTVKIHVRQILRKMKATNRTQVVATLNKAENAFVGLGS